MVDAISSLMVFKVEDIQTQNLRVSVNVDLRTPTILVPRHSKSIDILMVQLGDLSLKNHFNFTNVPPDMRQEWNHIYLNLNHIQMQRWGGWFVVGVAAL